jgi:hypothetical protein
MSAGMSLTKLSLAGNNLFNPARESLVNGIPTRDGKIVSLFYSVAPQDYGVRRWSLSILTEPEYLPDGQGVHVEEPVQVPDLQLTSSKGGAAAVPDQGEAGSLPLPCSTPQPIAAARHHYSK